MWSGELPDARLFSYLINCTIHSFSLLSSGASRVTAVDGHYQIGIYSVRSIEYGEEITFDYNSVTEVCSPLSLLLCNSYCSKVLFCFVGLIFMFPVHCLKDDSCVCNRVRKNMKRLSACVVAKYAEAAT